MEISRGKFDSPPTRRISAPSPIGNMANLVRLAVLTFSISALGCPGAGQRGRTSGVDAGGNHSSADANHTRSDAGDGIRSTITDANGDRRVVVADAGSVMDATDAGGDCHEPDDVKGGGVGACFHGDGKGGADAGNAD